MAAAVWLSFRNIDLAELGQALGRVRWLWALTAAANTVFSVYVLGWRWEILLRPQTRIPLGKLFRFNIISQMVNIAAPARMGEFVRAYLVFKEGGASVSFTLGTILVEHLLDLFVFSAVWIVTPALIAISVPFAPRSALRALFFVPALILISFAVWPKLFQRAAAFGVRLFPSKIRERILRIIQQALEAFATLRGTRTSTVLVAWTLGLIFSQILTIVLVFRAVGLTLGFGPALIVLLAIQAVSLPPSAPGKIGVYEYAVILALAAFRIGRIEALACGLILHLTASLPKIILGLVYLSGSNIRLRTLRTAEAGDKQA
jgi:uncharacterized protein (TIRG00374 family)